MKKISINIVAILLIAATLVLPSCKGDDDPQSAFTPKQQEVLDLLKTSAWKLKSVTVDGVAKDLYSDLTITFSEGSFTSSGGEPVWTSTGTWTFTDDDATAFKRNDQTVVSISAVDANNLTLSMTWSQNTIGPGRASSVAGVHVFVMGH